MGGGNTRKLLDPLGLTERGEDKMLNLQTPEQISLAQQMGGMLGNNLSQLYNMPQSSLGGFGMNQQDYYSNLLGFGQNMASQGLGGISPQMGSEAAGLGMQGLRNIMSPFDQSVANQSLQQGVENALSQTGEIRRSLLEPFAAAGSASSGGALRALQRGGENVSMGLGTDYLNKLYSGQMNQLGLQAGAIPAAQQYSQLPWQQGMGALGLLGGLQGQLMMEPYMRYQMMSGNILQPFNTLMGMPQQTYVQGGPSIFEQALPGIGQGLGTGLGIMAMSDERIKENFAKIEGALHKVEQIAGKTYNYKELPDSRRAGVMAQDVEKVLPEAVKEIAGVKMVDYNAVLSLVLEAVKELSRKVRDYDAVYTV